MANADWSAIYLSLKVSLFCLLLITPPGVLLAWILARCQFVGKSLLDALVHAPLVLPPVVTGYLLLVVLGRNGWIGHWLDLWFGIRISFSFSAAVLAAGIISFPLLVRAVRLAIELVDPGLEKAAATLGASPLRVFFSITLPLALPGLITGMTLAFARSLGEFGATIMFAGNIVGETQTLPLALFANMQVPGREGRVLLLALISLGLSLGALLVSEYYNRQLKARLRGNS